VFEGEKKLKAQLDKVLSQLQQQCQPQQQQQQQQQQITLTCVAFVGGSPKVVIVAFT